MFCLNEDGFEHFSQWSVRWKYNDEVKAIQNA